MAKLRQQKKKKNLVEAVILIALSLEANGYHDPFCQSLNSFFSPSCLSCCNEIRLTGSAWLVS